MGKLTTVSDKMLNRLQTQSMIADKYGDIQLRKIANVCSWGNVLGRPITTALERRQYKMEMDYRMDQTLNN